jgi:hypothetical protein
MSETPRNDTKRDARLAALYRAAAQDGPPVALDDAIRAAARRAVASAPSLAGAPVGCSWRVPLSIAAVIVLSVSLVTLLREEAPELVQPPRAEAPAADAEHRPAASAEAAGESAATAPKTLVPGAQRSTGVGLKPPLQVSRPGTGLRGDTEPPALAAGSGKDTAAAGPTPAPLAKLAAPEAFPGAADERDNKVAAPAKEPRQRPKDEARRDVAVPPPAKVQRRLEAEKPARSAEVAARAPVPQIAGVLEADANLPPEKWLERIADLRRQGRLEEAKRSLAEFRKRYPDYTLPASLQDGITP